MSNILATQFLTELESEAAATRKCLANIPIELHTYKPHEKSMAMRYLSLIVAEVPLWVATMVEKPEIDFVTFPHFQAKTTEELVAHFDDNMAKARVALQNITDEQLTGENFALKANGQLLYSSPRSQNIYSSINHMVHHRGQLTVYMRLNNLPVPSIYGPSADDRGGF